MTDDLKDVWRNQETETTIMTAAQLHHATGAHDSLVRRRIRIGYVGLAVIVLFGAWILSMHDAEPFLKLSVAASYASALLFAWRLRQARPRNRPAADAPAASVLDFYRSQLLKMRAQTNMRTGLTWFAILVLPQFLIIFGGTAVMFTHNNSLDWRRLGWSVAPVLAAAAVWFVVASFLVRRRARQLDVQIAATYDAERRLQE